MMIPELEDMLSVCRRSDRLQSVTRENRKQSKPDVRLTAAPCQQPELPFFRLSSGGSCHARCANT
jgi:hypothetical protein